MPVSWGDDERKLTERVSVLDGELEGSGLGVVIDDPRDGELLNSNTKIISSNRKFAILFLSRTLF